MKKAEKASNPRAPDRAILKAEPEKEESFEEKPER